MSIGVERSPDGAVVTVTLPGLPALDSNAAALAKAWGLHFHRTTLLTLEGPIERVGDHGVPIFRGCVFGGIEGRFGASVRGLTHGASVVRRLNLREVLHVPHWLGVGPHWKYVAGEVVETERGHVRTTLRRARNTARKGDAAIPTWEAFAAAQALASEAERLAEEAGYIGMTVEMIERVCGHQNPEHLRSAAPAVR